MSLDFGLAGDSALEDFDFDAFLHEDGDGDGATAFDWDTWGDSEEPGKTGPKGERGEHSEGEVVHEAEIARTPEIDAVDELVKRWTTVGV